MNSSSSDKSAFERNNIFSHKRYFINNLDSYHGQYVLKEMTKVLANNNAPSSTKESSRTMLGEDVVSPVPPPPEPSNVIIGTVIDPKVKSIDNVSRIVPKDECVTQMLTCGTVILDISYERDELRIAMEYMAVLKALLEKLNPPPKPVNDEDEPLKSTEVTIKKRYLILISTIMTWSATKPLDPDIPDMPFVEMDFRKRKPHPNYKIHYDAENELIAMARKYRSSIGALVVGTGVTYGGREDVLFYWFQKSWECEPILPILGRGNNAVPLINVADLAKIVYNLVDNFPKKLYILAVEQNVTKLKQIVKPLGRIVGSGMFKCILQDDAFLIPEIDQRTYELMTVNLNMEPTYIVETMGLQWSSELSFGDNVPDLMKEFKKERKLKAFKVLIYGPPLVGKTTLAKQVSENYGIIYISPETVVQAIIDDLGYRIRHWEVGETVALDVPTGEEEEPVIVDDEEEVDEDSRETARQTYAMLQSGRPIDDDEILGHLRRRMLSHEALNRGWVLDGFPKNLVQCASLFEKGEEQDSEGEDDVVHEPFDEDVNMYDNILKKLLPDIVVSLEATDDYICDKAMRQPEDDPRLGQEVVLKRLNEFRSGDTRDVTPLNFFDELDIHPLVVPVKDHQDYAMKQPYSAVSLRMGSACRYGKLAALIEAAEKKENEERATMRAKKVKALIETERKLKEEREEKMEYWTELYSLLREEEEAALAAAGKPMRDYLINHVFPTLTPALLEVAKVRPEDPVDFLAEYLFKLNPTGKMLEPGFNLQAEKLLGKIKILDDALKDLDIQIEPLLTVFDEEESSEDPINADIN